MPQAIKMSERGCFTLGQKLVELQQTKPLAFFDGFPVKPVVDGLAFDPGHVRNRRNRESVLLKMRHNLLGLTVSISR